VFQLDCLEQCFPFSYKSESHAAAPARVFFLNLDVQ